MGDEMQLEDALRKHRPFLREMVRREARRKQVPEERFAAIEAQVEVVVWQKWDEGPGHEGAEGRWRGWLTTIARYEILNEVRRVKTCGTREAPLFDDEPQPRARNGDDPLEPITTAAVIDAIEALHDPERRLMYLIVCEAWTFSEAAAAVGMNPDKARGVTRRTRRAVEGRTLKGEQAPAIIAFARKVKALLDTGDSRD